MEAEFEHGGGDEVIDRFSPVKDNVGGLKKASVVHLPFRGMLPPGFQALGTGIAADSNPLTSNVRCDVEEYQAEATWRDHLSDCFGNFNVPHPVNDYAFGVGCSVQNTLDEAAIAKVSLELFTNGLEHVP